MRPRYETERDRKAQRAVADLVIAGKPGCAWVEMPPLYVVDFVITRDGKDVGMLEVKCRTAPRGEYRDYAIGFAKWKAMIAEGRAQGLPVFFAVTFADGVRLWTPVVEIERARVYPGGRTDRHDKGDVEDMIHVPWALFRKLKG